MSVNKNVMKMNDVISLITTKRKKFYAIQIYRHIEIEILEVKL